MKTIAKNRKRYIQDLFQRATHCEVFTLDNSFRGRECSKWWAMKELFNFDFAKLKENGPGLFTVEVHSNLWYEIKSPINH